VTVIAWFGSGSSGVCRGLSMIGGGEATNVLFCAPGVPQLAADGRQAPPYWFGIAGLISSSEGPSPSGGVGHEPLSL
jgi:hypothetical protein